jgi:hypothetical protein
MRPERRRRGRPRTRWMKVCDALAEKQFKREGIDKKE